MSAVSVRIPEAQIEQARQTDVLALAERHADLRKVSGGEYAGPCPRCGGTDRFHVTAEWFFCRQCHEKRGDAIEMVRWLDPGLSFAEAVAQLTGGALPATPAPRPEGARKRQPDRKRTKVQPPEWRQRATALVKEAQDRLWASEGEPGQQYLLSRALEPHTWLACRLGYRPDTAVPGTEGQERAPAISMPWYASGKLVAVRYRFLETQHGHKQTAEYGSAFEGKLYGGQALPGWVTMPAPEGYQTPENLCTLLILEGEVNAMSCWQVAGETRLHILSLGSESAQITPAAVRFAQRYGQVIAWADRTEVAQRLMSALPGAHGLRSPGGKDANDLLQAGLLGGFLAATRADAAKGWTDLEALLWALYDAAALPLGIDGSTAEVLNHLAGKLGKRAYIVESEPNRWIAQ